MKTNKLINVLLLFAMLTSTAIGAALPSQGDVALAASMEKAIIPSLKKFEIEPTSPTATNWCVAGDFNGWNNISDPLNDIGSDGDLFASDSIYSLDFTVTTSGRHEWKAVECGNWGNAYPANNSWFYTSSVNQSVKFTFDTNDHSSDTGVMLYPTQHIVHAWADTPTSLTAVGDWQGWNSSDSTTLMTDMGNGIFRLEYVIPTAGTYMAKVVTTGTTTWDEQYTNDGKAIDGSTLNFTTASSNETVIFLVDTKTDRWTAIPNNSTTGSWCLAGGFNSWNNTSDPLYDDGTNGDLLGGDGVFSLDYTIISAGRDEWKIVECGNWSVAYPSDNAWVETSTASQVVKFTFDTNDHSNDAGMVLIPTQNIVNAWDDLRPSFTAVGDWQGWDPSNTSTTMTALANNYFLLNYAVSTPGTYEGKITETGAWNDQIGTDGRNKSALSTNFTIYAANDIAQFWLDGNQGRWAIITPPEGGAGHDNNIWWAYLGHNSRDSLYRNPGQAVITGTIVTLRLRAAENDLTGAKLRLYNDRTNQEALINMTRVASDGNYEYWEYQLDVGSDPTVYWYRFIPMDGDAVAYYEDDANRTGGWGQTFSESQDNSWQLTVYDPAYQTPDWVKNAVVYQIFPDRFRNGDGTNDTPAGSFFYDDPLGTIYRSNTTDWNEPICDPRDDSDPNCAGTYSQNFYGGDLQGIIDQLDYLENLGVTALYLNPIMESPSNHKYDTTNYSIIDDNFGDLATFQLLTTEAYSHGIRIIMDGVFNHTSSDSIYFDRYSRYSGDGACESATSQYRDWYYFTDVTPGTGPCVGSDGTPNAADYESWWGYDSLPKLQANSQDVRDLIWADGTNSIAPYWIDVGASGWRLDVAGDVDPGVTSDPNNDYWEGFRSAVRDVYSGTYITGEEWGNASSWLLGNEWDAVMNYQYSTAMLGFWRDSDFVDNDHNSASSAGIITPLDPSELDERLLNWLERYPPEAMYAMLNLLGSHDTNRALFMLDHNAATSSDDTLLDNPNYDWSDAIARLKGVAILQMTLPGAPTIYYGDEVGNIGPVTYVDGVWQDDPYNRIPFPWLDESGTPFYSFLQSQANQDALYDYYALLTNARNNHEALRVGSFDTLQTDDTNRVYAYGRKMADHSDAAVVVLNRGVSTATITVTVDGYLPVGAQFVNIMDDAVYTVDSNGELTVDVPDDNGAILVLTGTMATNPAAVSDLIITDERNAEIDLGWSAVSGADSYDVYRSPLSGGGYELITTTTSISYTDTGLQNAVNYYYVVVSRNSTTGLLSGYSNEVMGTPHHDLDAAWYNLDGPAVITHTISTITPTETISGQLYIAGATGSSGPADGIMAQIGFGVTGSLTTTWSWVDMSYAQAISNNDLYTGTLLPDAVGDYQFATRWSSDGGQSWYFSDLTGTGDNDDYGVLHVLPSSDTTPPAAPQNLEVATTNASSISLEWDANSEPDLGGYDVYRQPVVSSHAPTVFSHIARMDAGNTGYVDTDVVTDESYEYYIEAFDTSFNFSPPSNVVTATAEIRMITVTFRVRVPDYSPGTIYVAGNLPGYPEWNPGAIPMSQISTDPNIWEVDLVLPEGLSGGMYKYTRGTWEKVEWWGSIVDVNNRSLPNVVYGSDGTMLVDNTATDWGAGPDDDKAVRYWRDPLVVDFSPGDGASDLSVATTISTTWSVSMPTDTSFTVMGPTGIVSGSFMYDAARYEVVFTPDANLQYDSTYTVTVAGQVSNGGHTQQVPEIWSFGTVALPTVQFSSAAYTVTESVGSAAISVTLNKIWTDTVTIDASAGGSLGITETLTFVPGETTRVFEISIPSDDLPEPDEVIPLSLNNPVSATLGMPYTASLTILDDDVVPEVQFSTEAYTVTESVGTAGITVTLSRAASFTVTVDASAGGSLGVTEMLTFAPGETTQVFEMSISDDDLPEPDEVIPLSLSNPVSATLGMPHIATLTILDDDVTPEVQFSTEAYTVTESAGTAGITVTLSRMASFTVTVDVSAEGSLGVTETLIFTPGETSQVFEIVISDNAVDNPDEIVPLTLSNPVDAILGEPASATLTILDDDPAMWYIHLPIIYR